MFNHLANYLFKFIKKHEKFNNFTLIFFLSGIVFYKLIKLFKIDVTIYSLLFFNILLSICIHFLYKYWYDYIINSFIFSFLIYNFFSFKNVVYKIWFLKEENIYILIFYGINSFIFSYFFFMLSYWCICNYEDFYVFIISLIVTLYTIANIFFNLIINKIKLDTMALQSISKKQSFDYNFICKMMNINNKKFIYNKSFTYIQKRLYFGTLLSMTTRKMTKYQMALAAGSFAGFVGMQYQAHKSNEIALRSAEAAEEANRLTRIQLGIPEPKDIVKSCTEISYNILDFFL